MRLGILRLPQSTTEEEMEIRTYYVLSLTTGTMLSQQMHPFPVIDGDRDDRIDSGTRALQVFTDHKRAFEYLRRVLYERPH
jgi:hypothetical protein